VAVKTIPHAKNAQNKKPGKRDRIFMLSFP